MDKDFLKELVEQAQRQADQAKRKALRILIPAVIVGSLTLIGLGILIGKYLL